MVGSAIVRRLQQSPDVDVVTASRSEVDLLDLKAVREFLAGNDIDQIYLAAAKVGGIAANRDFPADFIWENLVIESNVVRAAHEADIDKLLFLGSSCIYPRDAPQPMPESALLTGTLEPTNEPYAIAKIAGIKMCESYNRQHGRDYRSVMPTNLYGPHDNFDPVGSHVLPALIRRFHEAAAARSTEVIVWGSGTPRREFLHVDDMADASVHVMELDHDVYAASTEQMLSHINVGTGTDCSIRELAELVSDVTGYEGELAFDASKPDGTPRKLLDVDRLSSLGWTSSIPLSQGIADTYAWFLEHQSSFRGR